MSTPAGPAEPTRIACGTCGAVPGRADAAARLAWSRGIENGRVVWTCPECTRRYARAIEGKLDSQWW